MSEFEEVTQLIEDLAPQEEDSKGSELLAPLGDFSGGSEDGVDEFLEGAGVRATQSDPTRVSEEKLYYPWMRYHHMDLVTSVQQLTGIIDAAIANGRCGLDVEATGLDTRIYEVDGKIQTVDEIVGYCISVRGHGYYCPIRHKFNPLYDEHNPNLDIDAVSTEITRLCKAAQPEEVDPADPLFGPNIKPGRLKIAFWNCKYDHEMLYPVTGIEFWHQSSYVDGMLACYTYYSGDLVGLKGKAAELLCIVDGNNRYPYHMIELIDLFPKGTKKTDIHFELLFPEVGKPTVIYGCCDAIATELLCDPGDYSNIDWKIKPPGFEFVSVMKRLEEPKKNFVSANQLELKTVQSVRAMERYRAPVDQSQVIPLVEEARAEEAILLRKIQAAAKLKGFPDFNPSSPEQLSELLFSTRGFDLNPKPKENTKGYSTESKVLEQLQEIHPDMDLLTWVINYRQVVKIVGTYLERLRDDADAEGRIRLNLKQHGTDTGRFSAPSGSEDGDSHGFTRLPIQGIPARDDPKKPKVAQSLRKLFRASPGYAIVKIDYSGQELRLVTNVSKEPLWINEFKNGDGDLHTLTARAFFGPHVTKEHKLERQMGKCVGLDTEIITRSGPMRIADLVPTDPTVELYDDFGNPHQFPFWGCEDGQTPVDFEVWSGYAWVRVVAIHNGGVRPLYRVRTTAGNLDATTLHRVKLASGDLVTIGCLQAGDRLEAAQTPDGPQDPIEVLGLEYLGPMPCLDLVLAEEPHLYSAAGIVTHNTANFALVYGGGVQAVMRATKCDKAEAERRKANFDKSVPVFAKWVEGQKTSVKSLLGVYDMFGRFIRIPEANIKSTELFQQRMDAAKKKGIELDPAILRKECERDARMIRASCERKAINYPIQGSGATVLKVVLPKIFSALYARGWLRSNGGDDSVRPFLTVHDEIVFEVRFNRLVEAVPLLRQIMESPSRIPGREWEVPLIAEPQIGQDWVAKYDWERLQRDEDYRPDWLKPFLPPATGTKKEEHAQEEEQEPAPKSTRPDTAMFVLARTVMTPQSINLVRQAIVRASPVGAEPQLNGKRLHLVDATRTESLIEPGDQIWVMPELFGTALRELNLGPGVEEQ